MIDERQLKLDFPMLNKKMQNHRLIYLDNASTTFKPRYVLNAIEDYYCNFTANSHRGDYDIAHKVDEEYGLAREKVASFINANANEIVFTSGASMSLNMIAHGYSKLLNEGDEILLTQAEHASNVLPWFYVAKEKHCQISYIPLDEKGRLTPDNLRKVISKRTKIVSVAHVTNVLGYVIDIKKICEIAHEFGAVVVCDGAQSVPHMKTDVKDLDVDFLVFSGHKMCGPTGIGVLYGKYDLLDKMDPLLSGGGMNARFDTCGNVSLLKPPLKFEAGTQNIEGVLGLKAAIEYLENIGMDDIEKHEKELKKYAIEQLKACENIRIYNEDSESAIITFNVKDVFAQDAATYFNSRGICVRSGQHCAKILMDFLNEVATVRASFYFYTTKQDIDEFVKACKKAGDFLDAYFN